MKVTAGLVICMSRVVGEVVVPMRYEANCVVVEVAVLMMMCMMVVASGMVMEGVVDEMMTHKL